MEEKKIRYEPEPKPELEGIKEVIPDTEEFTEPDKAKALIKHLNLQIGDTIQEDDNGEYYTINPKYELSGTSPKEYAETIKHFKALCTTLDIQKISKAMKRNTKDYDKKLYDLLVKKLDKKVEKNPKHESVLFFSKEMHSLHNTLYHLLSKDKEDYIKCYRAAWFEKPIPNIREWRKEDDGEYRVLTDSEAETACEDYLKDDTSLWQEAVKAGRTEASLDDWAEEVKNIDGRGNILSGYDGCEESEEVNGTEYYIYRTN